MGRKKAQEGGGGTSDGLCSRQGQFKGWVEAATGGSSQEADGTPEALGAELSNNPAQHLPFDTEQLKFVEHLLCARTQLC